MSDTYENYGQLKKARKENTDFVIRSHFVFGVPFIIVAPHAGGIELKTGPLAKRIAGDDLSLYRFIGKMPGGGNKILHITSHRFDEPECLKLIGRHPTVITIHGCEGHGQAIYIGGRDRELSDRFAAALKAKKLSVFTTGHGYPGEEAKNICNLGSSREGVQFELTLALREGRRANVFADTVRAILSARMSADIRRPSGGLSPGGSVPIPRNRNED